MNASGLQAQIERSAAWWRDHGPSVRSSSAEAYREHCGKMLMDSTYRANYLLGEKMNAASVRRQGLNVPQRPSKPYPSKLVGNLVDRGDRIGMDPEVGDLGFADYLPPLLSLQNVTRQERAEKEFLEFAQAETGMELSEKEYAKQKKQQRSSIRDSREIAAKLVEAGSARIAEMREIVASSGAPVSEYELEQAAEEIRATFDPHRHDAYSLFVYWLHSKTVEAMPHYRRTCLLPYVAAMTRAPKLAALEYFIQEHPYCRFWTFTTGGRCNAYGIPARLDWLFDKLRALNKELHRRWGISIVFRSTEFGSLENAPQGTFALESEGMEAGSILRGDDGAAFYHPHAHCVVYSARGRLSKHKWRQVIGYVNKTWTRNGQRVHWDAGEIIQDARECCKYVTKPGDIIKLPPLELAAFADATRGRRLVRPMGILAEEIRDRRENGRILRRSRIGSRMVWSVKLNHNRLTSETDEERAARENLEDAYAFTEECQRLAHIEPPSYPGAIDGGIVTPKTVDVDTTKVLARIGPAAGPTVFKEPRVIIMTNRATPDMRTVLTHPLVAKLWCETVAEWEAGRAASAAIRVHTGTLTGEAEETGALGFDPPPLFGPEWTSGGDENAVSRPQPDEIFA